MRLLILFLLLPFITLAQRENPHWGPQGDKLNGYDKYFMWGSGGSGDTATRWKGSDKTIHFFGPLALKQWTTSTRPTGLGSKMYMGVNTDSLKVDLWNGTSWLQFPSSSELSAINSLNGLTSSTQSFSAPGTTGTDPNWSSSGSTHTLNIPIIGVATNSGLMTNAAQTIGGAKTWSGSPTFNANVVINNTNSLLFSSRSRFSSSTDGMFTMYNNAQSSFTQLNFGGNTSSFPGIRVNGTSIQLRLGDNSADAAGIMAGITLSGLTGTGTRITTLSSTGVAGAITNGSDGQVMTMVSGSPAWANASGGISGSGTSGRLAYWNGSSSVTSDAGLLYSSSGNGTLSVGTTNTQGYLNIGAIGNIKTLTASGQLAYFEGGTFNDNTTSASGTSASWNFFQIGSPIMTATNSNVTTPSAVTLSVAAPADGTNHTTQIKRAIQTTGSVFFGGSTGYTLSTVTANTTLGLTASFIYADATGGGFNVTLPDASIFSGVIYTIKKKDSSGNAITVNTTSSQNIDGNPTKSLSAQYQYVVVQSVGDAWMIIGGN